MKFRIITSIGLVIALGLGIFATVKSRGGLASLGAGGTPPSAYFTTLSAPLTSSGTTISVATMTLDDATALTTATIYPGIFLTIEPGSSTKREIVYCTTVSSLTFTGCTRGLSSIGTSMAAVTAEQQAHNSGVSIIAADPSQFYTYTLMNRWADQWVEGKHHNKSATSSDRTGFSLGDGTDTDVYLVISNGNSTTTKPFIMWDESNDYFIASGDGVSSIVLGGSTASTTAGKNLNLTGSVMGMDTTIFVPAVNASSTFASTTMWSSGTFRVDGTFNASSTVEIAQSATTSHIYPWSNSLYDLGAFDFAWNNVYASGTTYLDELSVSSTASHILPNANGAFNLGSFGNAWGSAYVSSTLYVGNTDLTTALNVYGDMLTYGDVTLGNNSSDILNINGYMGTDILGGNTDLGSYAYHWDEIFASGTLKMGSNNVNTTSTFAQSLEIAGNIGNTAGAGATTTIANNLQINEDLNVTGDIMVGGADVWKHEYISSETDTGTDTNVINFTVPADTKYALIRYDTKYLQAGAFTVSNIYIDGTTGGSYLSDEAGDAEGGCGINLTWNTTSTPVNIFGNVTSCDSTYKDSRVIIYYYK